MKTVKRRCRDVLIATALVAAFVSFSAVAPLAHLHRDHAHHPHGSHGPTFHAHFEGHDEPESEYGGETKKETAPIRLAHGSLDGAREIRLSVEVLAVTPAVETPLSSRAFWLAVADREHDAHAPPLLFRKPVRAPPIPA